MAEANLSSEQHTPWFIVLYEWQACQEMSADLTWWPSAEILSSETAAQATIERKRNDKPQRGRLTYRNIRGPFSWSEPTL